MARNCRKKHFTFQEKKYVLEEYLSSNKTKYRSLKAFSRICNINYGTLRAWGHKIDRHHTNIATYASNIAQWAKKQNKEIGYIYDKVKNEEESFEYTRFIAPQNFGKLKIAVPNTILKVFEKDIIQPQCIIY